MTTPLTDAAAAEAGMPSPPAPPSSPSAAPRPSRSDRFFSWTAGVGVVRGDGWLGGVAAGLAARMRIDPLIVRGILVVVTLFGFPTLILYGFAWALLPDLDGRIPLQEAVRGRFTPALAGAAVLAVLGLAPAPFLAILGLPTFWTLSGSVAGYAVLALVFGGLVTIGLVALISRSAARAPYTSSPVPPSPPTPYSSPASGASHSEQRVASAAVESPEPPVVADSGSSDHAGEPGVGAAGFAASAPPTPPTPGDDTELAAWRAQHAAWKEQDAQWRREQQDATRVAREQARRERQERGAIFAAEAAERRRLRRLTAPRTPLSYLAIVIGIAVIAGATVALLTAGPFAAAAGLFIAAAATGAGMIVAGLTRRRSGFLAFVTVLLLLGGVTAMAVPAQQQLHVGSYSISNFSDAERWPASAPFVQPWGTVSVYLTGSDAHNSPIHIIKLSGWTSVDVSSDVTIAYDIIVAADMLSVYDEEGTGVSLSGASVQMADGRTRFKGTIRGGPGAITQTLVIDQQSGGVDIYIPRSTEDSE